MGTYALTDTTAVRLDMPKQDQPAPVPVLETAPVVELDKLGLEMVAAAAAGDWELYDQIEQMRLIGRAATDDQILTLELAASRRP